MPALKFFLTQDAKFAVRVELEKIAWRVLDLARLLPSVSEAQTVGEDLTVLSLIPCWGTAGCGLRATYSCGTALLEQRRFL